MKVHARVAPRKRSIDPSDYPMGTDVAAVRDVASLIVSAKTCGAHVGIYAQRLPAVPLSWTRMRFVDALLHLCKEFGNGRDEAICAGCARVRCRRRAACGTYARDAEDACIAVDA
ncbi:hypothetical protein [Sorangium sp. So ce1000]|uniref:hypothetical protein n=1 Tax=Sorangium sp. So ce1000 TaxID=3133325 RepID=UPI003F5F9577